MGNITLSLEESDEKMLRTLAAEHYQNKKGALSKVISDALNSLKKETKRERAMQRQLEWMDKGFEMGKILIKSRDEIYDRKIKN